MESLARLVVLMFLSIQIIAVVSVVLAYFKYRWLSTIMALLSLITALLLTQAFLFWVLPACALLFALYSWIYSQ